VAELRCVTVQQPWAALEALGLKPVEIRGVPMHYRGLLGIHAGQTCDPRALRDPLVLEALDGLRSTGRRDIRLTCGAVLAVANVVDCHRAAPYAPDRTCCQPWGWVTYGGKTAQHIVLTDVRRLTAPVPCRGSQAMPWRAPEDVAAAVWAQLEPTWQLVNTAAEARAMFGGAEQANYIAGRQLPDEEWRWVIDFPDGGRTTLWVGATEADVAAEIANWRPEREPEETQ